MSLEKFYKIFEVTPSGELKAIFYPDYSFYRKEVNKRKPGWGPFACFKTLEEVRRYKQREHCMLSRKTTVLMEILGVRAKETYCYSACPPGGYAEEGCEAFSVDHAVDSFKIIKEVPMHVSELFAGLSGRFVTVFYRLNTGETKRYNGQVESTVASDTVADTSKYVTLRVNRKTDGSKIFRTLKLENIRLVKANKSEYFIGQGGILEAIIN